MRFAYRLILVLVLSLTVVSFLWSFGQINSERLALRNDLQRRAEGLGESLAAAAEPLVQQNARQRLQQVVDRFTASRQLMAISIYDKDGLLLAGSGELAPALSVPPVIVGKALNAGKSQGEFLRMAGQPVHLFAIPLRNERETIGGLVVVHNTSYLEARTATAWRDALVRLLVQVLLIVGITMVVVRTDLIRPITTTAQWMRALRTGNVSAASAVAPGELLLPIANEVTTLAKTLTAARASAEQEARLRDAADWVWTAERLAVHLKNKLQANRLLVVSNREPYIHSRKERDIEVTVPASGLVTALEPVLNVCDGTWVAHGSGDADREVVDSKNCLRVPPEHPRYTLRRVWLTKEEEEGYYYGFSNEGLWPLCHIAHTRPIFRDSDWKHYQEVNAKFADAVLEEVAEAEEPVIFVQDYHFALLPRLLKKRRPDARVAIFWHIPWPNPEAFAICPWQAELLDGLLGADLIGFHVQTHCHNFLQTVDNALECRIDWASSTAHRANHTTHVKPFPISVDVAEPAPDSDTSIYLAQQPQLLNELGVEALFMGIGVDRVDYTKGIHERFLAIERFLEKYPTYQGQFTFVQIGSPSRTHLRRYHELMTEVESAAERINWRFKTSRWKPIVFLNRHHSHEEIDRFYRAADLCLVTSLHDGMNLVAKEFLAARADEQGMLVLSRFAGASRELRDALLVNPYDVDGVAEAIRTALEMPSEECRLRMRRMRRAVRDHNIYRWAATIVGELTELWTEPRLANSAQEPTAEKAQAAHAS